MGRYRTKHMAAASILFLSVGVGGALVRGVVGEAGAITIRLDIRPTALAVDGTVGHIFAIGAADNRVSVIDERNGVVLRTVRVGNNPTDLAVDEQTSRVFISNILDGTVSVLDARSGDALRTVAVGDFPLHIAQRMAVDARAGHVFVANTAGVSMLDATMGTLLRATPLDAVDSGITAVAVDERTGHAFAVDRVRNSVSMLDARTGKVLRTTHVGDAPFSVLVASLAGRVFVAGRASVSTLDARSGRVIHTSSIGMDTTAAGVEAATLSLDPTAGRVFVTNPRQGTVVFLDARTGSVAGVVAPGPAYLPVVSSQDGRAFVVTSGCVRMLDAKTGKLLRSVAISPNSTALAVVRQVNRIVIVSSGAFTRDGMPAGPGRVIILDARSGRVMRTVPLGWSPHAIAVDGRNGQTMIANYGNPALVRHEWQWVPSWLRDRLPMLPSTAHTDAAPGSVTLFAERLYHAG